jgi:hypothetical protein
MKPIIKKLETVTTYTLKLTAEELLHLMRVVGNAPGADAASLWNELNDAKTEADGE